VFVLKFVIKIIQWIHTKIKFFFEKRKFCASILIDVEKGILTEIEKNNILVRCKELNLIIGDLKKIRSDVFDIAFEKLTENGFLTSNKEKDSSICANQKFYKKLFL